MLYFPGLSKRCSFFKSARIIKFKRTLEMNPSCNEKVILNTGIKKRVNKTARGFPTGDGEESIHRDAEEDLDSRFQAQSAVDPQPTAKQPKTL